LAHYKVCLVITEEDQTKLQMNPTAMLEDEVAWLGNFVPSQHPDMSDTDNSLLAGHLKLITTLLTCEGVDEEEHGRYNKKSSGGSENLLSNKVKLC
jgi:hypothetical protein